MRAFFHEDREWLVRATTYGLAEYKLADHVGGGWTVVWYERGLSPKFWDKLKNNARSLGARHGLGPQTQDDNDAYLNLFLGRNNLAYQHDGSVVDGETGDVYDWPMKKVFFDSGIKNFPELVGNLVMFCLLARRVAKAKAAAVATAS